MAITTQDMIRFGLIADPKAYLKSETQKWRESYESDISKQYEVIRSATTDREYDRAYQQLNRLVEQRERKFTQIDKEYNRLLARQEYAISNPVLNILARQRIEEEVGQERAQMQEESRREMEGIQRGEAEREAARSKSRRAGGGRGMLAGYGVSLPQGIGGRATLGRASTLGSPMGGAAASTLGRSLLG
jgi:hypothetical protein